MNVFVFFFDSSTVQVQLTDFENAAYVTFVVLLTRVILSFDLNLLIPLSKVTLKGILFVRQLVREGSCPFVGLDNARVREFRGHNQLIMNAILEKKITLLRAKLELKSKKLLSREILAPNPRFLPQQRAFWWCPPSSFIIFMKISCQFTCAWVERGLVRGTNSVSQRLIIQLQNRHSLRFESSRIQRFLSHPWAKWNSFLCHIECY